MSIKMLSKTFDSTGRKLLRGVVYDDVSQEDEKILIDREKAEATDETPTGGEMTVAEIVATLPELTDDDILKLRETEEKSGKTRKGVMDAIDKEIESRKTPPPE